MGAHRNDGPVRIGVVGLGRTGWQNHCRQIATLPDQFRIVATADADAARRDEAAATFGCRTFATPEELFADDEIEIVTIATPSHLHLPHALAAFSAGKDVVCEKPLAGSSADAERMITTAEKAGRLLTVFQNRRFSPDFRKVREIIVSGALGRIVQIRIASHTYGRRWDWQTLRKFHGGELNNTASHLIDQALLLLGNDDPEVFCHLDRALSCGDAEDHVKVAMRSPGSPLVEVEVSYAVAMQQDRWIVMGTEGGLSGTGTTLRWRTSNVASLPSREPERTHTPERRYYRDTYEWQEGSWTVPADEPTESVWFYRALYATLREGAPLAVTPESVRRQIEVLDRCRASGARTLAPGSVSAPVSVG